MELVNLLVEGTTSLSLAAFLTMLTILPNLSLQTPNLVLAKWYFLAYFIVCLIAFRIVKA